MFFQLIFATNERPYSLAFEQKKNWSSDHWFHSASNYFEIA